MVAAIIISLSLSFAVVSGSKCDLTATLPNSVPLNYMEKIGIWYQTVSSNDPISADYICGTYSNVNVNSDSESFTMLITKYYKKTTPRQFTVNDRRTIDGYFERLKVDYREIPALLTDQDGKWNAKALEEDYHITIDPDKHSYIGDGARYFAYVKCTLEGWAVWIYTPQKVLEADELLYIHNELVKNGIHTELRLGKCEDINP